MGDPRPPEDQESHLASRSIAVPHYVANPSAGGHDSPETATPREKVQYLVEEPRCVERVVDVPYEVVVEVPVPRYIENKYYIDREIEVPVERVVEAPPVEVVQQYRKVTALHRLAEPATATANPNGSKYAVFLPVVHVEHNDHAGSCIERDVFEYVEIAVPSDEIVEVASVTEKFEEVEVVRERIKESASVRALERVVELQRVVERPTVTTRVVEKPIEKVIERRVEVPVAKIVEVPQIVEEERVIEIVTRRRRPLLVVQPPKTLHVSITRKVPAKAQTAIFSSLGQTLSSLGVDNLKLELEISAAHDLIEHYLQLLNGSGTGDERQVGSSGASIGVSLVEGYSEDEVVYLERTLEFISRKNDELRAMIYAREDRERVGSSLRNHEAGHQVGVGSHSRVYRDFRSRTLYPVENPTATLEYRTPTVFCHHTTTPPT